MALVSAMILDPLASCFCLFPRDDRHHRNNANGKEACKSFMLTLDPAEHKTPILGPFYHAFHWELGLKVEFFDNYGNKFSVIVKKNSSEYGTFCNGIKSIILHYEIKHCVVLKGTYVGPNRVSFSVLKHDMNPIHPPKRSTTMHGLCISDMGCVNQLQTDLATHRRILHGHATRRRVCFEYQYHI
ncbi:hypothetical protein PIB30_012761 [Stylosanthes scabra]|uniref:Uncharacterized protein n=1 Tax=Stylosanthes scabra TaxID=79078 RepID=A0ABU6S7L1_9FABA|nr:hypothetical protein [Stylosanthes scabra]